MPQDATGDHWENQDPSSDLADSIFARRLRAVRTQAGATQKQLADRMAARGYKMLQSTVAKIESGERPVSIGEAVQLAEVLGVDLGELTTERPGDPVRDKALHERAEVRIRVRSLQHLAAERHKELEAAQFLYEHAAKQLEQAQRELSSLDLRLKFAEQQARPETSAWVAPESEDDQ
jgi:transcriptional regulator with XRE-family HTH domain